MGKPRPSKPSLKVDEDGFRKLKKPFQERIVGGNHSIEHSLEPRSTLPVATSVSGDVGEAKKQLSLPTGICPTSDHTAPIANSFDILGHLPSDVELQTLINTALGAHPIHGND